MLSFIVDSNLVKWIQKFCIMHAVFSHPPPQFTDSRDGSGKMHKGIWFFIEICTEVQVQVRTGLTAEDKQRVAMRLIYSQGFELPFNLFIRNCGTFGGWCRWYASGSWRSLSHLLKRKMRKNFIERQGRWPRAIVTIYTELADKEWLKTKRRLKS